MSEEDNTSESITQTVGEKTTTMRDIYTSSSPHTIPGFFDALSNGYLFGGECENCGTVLIPPRNACYACGGQSIVVKDQPKTGVIISYTEVRHPPAGFDMDDTYTTGVVELDSSGRVPTRIDAPIDEIEIGDAVMLRLGDDGIDRDRFDLKNEQEWPMFVFEPVDETPSEDV